VAAKKRGAGTNNPNPGDPIVTQHEKGISKAGKPPANMEAGVFLIRTS